jgi:NitT/TauT family transport system permease protein
MAMTIGSRPPGIRMQGPVPAANPAAAGAVRPLPERQGAANWTSEHLKPALGSLTVVVLLGAWQLCADTRIVDPAFVSSPSAIARAGVAYVSSAQFGRDAAASGLDFAIGFAFAVVVGILIGFAMGWFRLVSYALDYVVSLAYSAPRIALVPVLIVWFGIGARSEIVTIFTMAVFPMIINTATGVRTVDRNLVELARSFNARPLHMFRTIILPATVPHMISGVRLAIGVGLVGVVVAEFTAASVGIGYMMQNAANSFQTAQLFVGLVIISLAGLLLTQLARRLERHFDRWRTEVH